MQLVASNQGRHVALVRDVEEHGGKTGKEPDREQLGHGQHAERGRDNNGPQYQHARDVADDHQAPLRDPIDNEPGGQCDKQEADGCRRGQQPDLEGRRVQEHDGGQRQRDEGDRRADLANGLPGPEQHEVPVPPKAPAGLIRFAGSVRSVRLLRLVRLIRRGRFGGVVMWRCRGHRSHLDVVSAMRRNQYALGRPPRRRSRPAFWQLSPPPTTARRRPRRHPRRST